MSREVEFDVYSITQTENKNYSIVGGTCYKDDIKIGDEFLKAYRVITRKSVSGLSYEFERLGIEEIRDVKLQVVRVIIFRYDIDELTHGYSGGLHLKGEGGDSLKEGDRLGFSYPDNINSCPLK